MRYIGRCQTQFAIRFIISGRIAVPAKKILFLVNQILFSGDLQLRKRPEWRYNI